MTLRGKRAKMWAMPTDQHPLKDKLPEDLDPEVRRKFYFYANKLDRKGVLAGTYHKRTLIPKSALSTEEIRSLGFVPVAIAIPESGQDSFISYRHPELLHHIHSHPKYWTMHEDEHPALTMALRKAGTPAERAEALLAGSKHIATEGLPGLYKYVTNRFTASKDMLNAIKEDLKTKYNERKKDRKKEASMGFVKLADALERAIRRGEITRDDAYRDMRYHYMADPSPDVSWAAADTKLPNNMDGTSAPINWRMRLKDKLWRTENPIQRADEVLAQRAKYDPQGHVIDTAKRTMRDLSLRISDMRTPRSQRLSDISGEQRLLNLYKNTGVISADSTPEAYAEGHDIPGLMGLQPQSSGGAILHLPPVLPDKGSLGPSLDTAGFGAARGAIGEHELGEVEAIRRLTTAPWDAVGGVPDSALKRISGDKPPVAYATHADVRPLVREELGLYGAPVSRKSFRAARAVNPDDRLATRAYGQAGGRPTAPIPLDSRQERGLRSIMQTSYDRGLTTRPNYLDMIPAQLRPRGQLGIPRGLLGDALYAGIRGVNSVGSRVVSALARPFKGLPLVADHHSRVVPTLISNASIKLRQR